jgi:predicted dehydrogenase
MFMHNQRLQKMKSVLEDGTSVGTIRRIASHFCFLGGDGFSSENIRTNSSLEPLGCLGDLGWYNIRFALWALNYQMPIQVTCRMLDSQQDSANGARVPIELSAELLFENGVTASFYNSFIAIQQQWAHITGVTGELQMDDFVQPFKGDRLTFRVVRNVGEQDRCDATILEEVTEYQTEEQSHSAETSQETELFRRFSGIVNCGIIETQWSEMALKTQQVVDAAFQSAHNDGLPVKLQT